MEETDLSPLDALAEGFVDPSSPDRPHPWLRSSEGMALVSWLQAEGLPPDTVVLAEEAFRALGERYRPDSDLSVLRDRLKTQVAAGGFMAWPNFSLLLDEAIHRLSGPDQWNGLLAYLRWLAQVLQVTRA